MTALETLKATAALEGEKVVPVTVLVHWSESRHFPFKEKVYPYTLFEQKARSAARDAGVGRGYDKTKITVTLSNGDTIQVRCDLSETEDHGFASVVRCYQNWLRNDETGKEELAADTGSGFYHTINRISV